MLPVFFLRALVPAGFMPASAAQGQPLTMAMCPAHAPLPRTSPKPSPTSPARHHQAPCVFAAAAAGIAPLPTVAFCLTLDQRSIEVEPAPLASPPARLVPRANNPRAPPTHA
jgi:hypothetical protein